MRRRLPPALRIRDFALLWASLFSSGVAFQMLAVAIGDGTQEFDARTLQDHASPHTYSDLLFKNALSGRARNTFGGLIRVEPHAHFTDAYQKVRNLLLSDDAEANSMPGLEIMADIKERLPHHPPVVILSNYGEPTMIDRGISLGALEYLVKSRVTPASVSQSIRGWIEQARQGRSEPRN